MPVIAKHLLSLQQFVWTEVVMHFVYRAYCMVCVALFQDGVGMTAINDSFFLESAVFQILRKHIRDQPYYQSVVELFHDVSNGMPDGVGGGLSQATQCSVVAGSLDSNFVPLSPAG